VYATIDVSTWELAGAEAPGQRPKEWLIDPKTREYALLKLPRYHSWELAAEKASAEIARILNISAARTELATRDGEMGIISYKFLSVEENLVHGGDLLVGIRPGYYRARPREQTFQLIRRVMPPHLLGSMIEMIVLDAVIGNTDRHHDNWALIRLSTEPDRLAPAYDHGSCLGSHVDDDKLSTLNINAFVRRGRAAIRWAEDERIVHLSHPQLLQRVRGDHPEEVRSAVGKVIEALEHDLVGAIRELPVSYAPRIRQEFMTEILLRRVRLLAQELGP
jgi:hypothetical protein